MKIKSFLTVFLAVLVVVFIALWQGARGRDGELTRALAEAQSRAGQARDQLTRVEDISAGQKTELEHLRGRVKGLETELLNRLDRLNQLTAAVDGADKLLAAAKSEAQSLRDQAERLKASEAEARSKAGDLEKSAAEATASLAAANSRLAAYEAGGVPACPPGQQEAEKERLMAQAVSLKLEVTRASAELSALRQLLSRDYERLAGLKKNLAMLASESPVPAGGGLKAAYARLAHDLADAVAGGQLILSEEPDNLKLVFKPEALFNDGADLSPAGVAALDRLSETLKDLESPRVALKMSADPSRAIEPRFKRQFPSAWDLAAARAAAAARQLTEKSGLPSDEFSATVLLTDARDDPAGPGLTVLLRF